VASDVAVNTVQWLSSASNLGNSALLFPLALFLGAMLWRYHSLRAAIDLTSAVVLCALLIVALKILLLACGRTWGLSVESPSAHACLAATVYGALGTITAQLVTRWCRVVVALGVISIIALIACSRVLLGAHSTDEVLIGLLIGGAASCWFAGRYLQLRTDKRLNIALLLGGSLALVIVLHSAYLPFEQVAENFALKARSALFACPRD
jgi:membrane-associated phospholipid phosphatase